MTIFYFRSKQRKIKTFSDINLSKVPCLVLKFLERERAKNILGGSLPPQLLLRWFTQIKVVERVNFLPCRISPHRDREIFFRDDLYIYLNELVIQYAASTHNVLHSKMFSTSVQLTIKYNSSLRSKFCETLY